MSSTQTDQITKHLASCEPCLEELAPLIESGHLPLEGFETAVRSIEINSLRDRTIDPDEIAVPSGQISLSMWVLRVSTIAVSAVVIVIILSLVKPRRVAELDIARMEHALSQGKYEVALDEATQSLELVRRSDSRRRLIAIAEAASAAAANDALRDGDFERVREIRQLADRHGFLSAEMAVASYAAERGYSTTNLMRLLSRPDRDYGFSLDGTRQRRERESDELAQLIVLRERMESDLDRFPDSPVLLKNYGQLLLELDEPDSAGSVFEKYIADHDQDVDVSIGLGIVSLILGKQEIAESRFRIVAMDQGPNNVSARVGLAIALNQQDEQRSEEAYELLKGVQQVTRDADLKRNIEEFLGSAVDPQSALPGANSGVRGQFWGG